MSRIKKHPPVKLVIGLIYKDEDTLSRALSVLSRVFGSIDYESSEFAFNHTDYYKDEFGTDLKRRFIGFKKLISPQQLARIKISTNKIESKLSAGGKRRINIDPGYLELPKFVLATTKDFRHRIYLMDGIFAEVTLYYQDKSFKFWEWTYPDYRNPEYIEIFNHLREIYKKQITPNP
ncbi:MAG: DUF4416 family protein [Candidatus Omnitrophica bacterium]|nr:DUF4416 family protein [Candidatus Omnitrophota bacterium]